MSTLAGLKVVVVGAGAFGVTIALRLRTAGAAVRLFDASELGDSASGVAAGMLAPGLETLLDPASSGHYDLLRHARDLWPDLADQAEAPGLLDRSGAVFVADDEAAVLRLQERARQEGVEVEPLGATASEALSPGLAVGAGIPLFIPGEWRVPPPAALGALSAALQRMGGVIDRRRVVVDLGRMKTADGEAVEGDLYVIASGAEAAGFARLAPVLGALEPIKGQIIQFAGGPVAGPIVRSSRAYVAPQPGGALVGATMERGRSDRLVDPDVVAQLRAEGERLFPALKAASAVGRAGVRLSSPDGLPLVGRVSDSGVHLAVAARRNGWLLAPLVAEVVLAAAEGRETDEAGRLFAPDRFRPPEAQP